MFKVFVRYPSFQEEFEIARRTTAMQTDAIEPVLAAAEILELQRIVREVPVSDHVIRYALALVRQTPVGEPGVPIRPGAARLGGGPAGGAVPDPRRQGPGTAARPHPRHRPKTSRRWPSPCCATGWC